MAAPMSNVVGVCIRLVVRFGLNDPGTLGAGTLGNGLLPLILCGTLGNGLLPPILCGVNFLGEYGLSAAAAAGLFWVSAAATGLLWVSAAAVDSMFCKCRTVC